MPTPSSAQPELSERAHQLLGVLVWHREMIGVGEPLTDAQLARITGFPRRDIVDLADELLRRGQIVIASCDRRSPGRCLLRTGDDLAPALRYLESLQRRGKAIFGRYAHLRDALRARGQLNLPLEIPA